MSFTNLKPVFKTFFNKTFFQWNYFKYYNHFRYFIVRHFCVEPIVSLTEVAFLDMIVKRKNNKRLSSQINFYFVILSDYCYVIQILLQWLYIYISFYSQKQKYIEKLKLKIGKRLPLQLFIIFSRSKIELYFEINFIFHYIYQICRENETFWLTIMN